MSKREFMLVPMSGANEAKRYPFLNASVMRALRAFDAAVTHLSFTRAADELCVTQGAISQQIKLLEAQTGLQLFSRQPGVLGLTQDGLVVAEVVHRTMGELNETIARLRQGRDKRIAVSCCPSFAMIWLMPRLARFYKECPGIDLQVKAEYHDVSAVKMKLEKTDIAIRYDVGGSVGASSIDLMDEYLVPVAGAELARAFTVLPDKEKLEQATLLHDSSPWDGAPAYSEWCDWLDTASAKLNIDRGKVTGRNGALFNLSDLALKAAGNNQGVAIGRSALVLESIEEGRLVRFCATPLKAMARYRVLLSDPFLDGDPRSRFVDWLKEEVEAFVCSRALAFGFAAPEGQQD